MKKFIPFFLVFLGLSVLGYFIFVHAFAVPDDASQNSAPFAQARTGDLQIIVSGAGNLVLSESVILSFETSGILEEVLVGMGSTVEAGNLIARLDDTQTQLALEEAVVKISEFVNPATIAEAEVNVLLAEESLAAAEQNLASVIAGPPVAYYEWEVVSAQDNFQTALMIFNLSIKPSGKLQAEVEKTKNELEDAQEDLEWALNYEVPEEAIQRAEAEVDYAQSQLTAAHTLLAYLNGVSLDDIQDPTFSPEIIAIERAALALHTAEENLTYTEVISPIEGTVITLEALPGEAVKAGSPFATIISMESLEVQFYLDEGDLTWVSLGDPVALTFPAYEGQTFTGMITHISPVLVEVDRVPMVEVWASIIAPAEIQLMSGLSVDVEVTAVDIQSAILVPIQAVFEAQPGLSQVVVLDENGQPEFRTVQVGISDYANIVIESGLAAGEKVSTQPQAYQSND